MWPYEKAFTNWVPAFSFDMVHMEIFCWRVWPREHTAVLISLRFSRALGWVHTFCRAGTSVPMLEKRRTAEWSLKLSFMMKFSLQFWKPPPLSSESSRAKVFLCMKSEARW